MRIRREEEGAENGDEDTIQMIEVVEGGARASEDQDLSIAFRQS